MDAIHALAQARREFETRLGGMFGEGASGAVADDAPLQTRYLDTFGRRP